MSHLWPVQLSCVVFGTALSDKQSLTSYIRDLDLVSRLDEISGLSNLRKHLSRQSCNFVVIVLDHADDTLPACILRYPEMKVLVITPARKAGSVEAWLPQGASDIVSCHRAEKMKFAIRRMVEESRVKAQLNAVQEKLDSQCRLQRVLLESRKEAIMLWQNGVILDSNRVFDGLIDCYASDICRIALTTRQAIGFNDYQQPYRASI